MNSTISYILYYMINLKWCVVSLITSSLQYFLYIETSVKIGPQYLAASSMLLISHFVYFSTGSENNYFYVCHKFVSQPILECGGAPHTSIQVQKKHTESLIRWNKNRSHMTVTYHILWVGIKHRTRINRLRIKNCVASVFFSNFSDMIVYLINLDDKGGLGHTLQGPLEWSYIARAPSAVIHS